MRTVRDEDGNRYLLVKRSGESSLVRDPEAGEERYLPKDALETVDASPLETVATESLSGSIRALVTAVPDERGLGLLLELDDRGPVSVRALLGDYDLCESDLNGLLGEFRAAGLLRETEVGRERAYATTDACSDALDSLAAGQ